MNMNFEGKRTKRKNKKRSKPNSCQSSSNSEYLNHSSKGFTPYLDGERCLLCHCERPDSQIDDNSDSQSPNSMTQSITQLLWVCPTCRRSVEEEEKKASIQPSLLNHELLQPSVNFPFPLPESRESERYTTCNCQVCTNQRDTTAELERETQQLQSSWMEVRHVVRCVYREAGTTLSDNEEILTIADINKIKEHIKRLCARDPHQLYERLEAQCCEYVLEVKLRLIRHLTSAQSSPHHAREFYTMLLDEYQALCTATDILQPVFTQLEQDHLKKFHINWRLLNKHLFYSEIFTDPVIQGSVPALITQLRLGAASAGSYHHDTYPELLKRYLKFNDEMSEVRLQWKNSQTLIDKHNEEQEMLREKQKILKQDWENNKIQNKRPEKEKCNCENCLKTQNNLSAPPSSTMNGGTIKTSIGLLTTQNSTDPQEPTVPSLWDPMKSCTGTNHLLNLPGGLTATAEIGGISSSQLLPTALVLNTLASCQCKACVRDCVNGVDDKDGFTEDDVNPPCNCPNHMKQPRPPDSNMNPLHNPLFNDKNPPPSLNQIHLSPPHTCSNSDFHLPQCHPLMYANTPPHSPPEPSSPLHNILLNNSFEKHINHHFHNNLNGSAEWEDIDDDDMYEMNASGSDIMDSDEIIRMSRGTNSLSGGFNIEAPPGSPSSVRSHGDGSSCDTPTGKSTTSTSTSTSEDSKSNGKYCDCCYCEFFGHGNPPMAPTSNNFLEMREKLRQKLTQRKPHDSESEHCSEVNSSVDNRSVDELLLYINGPLTESSNTSKAAKAAKKARQKQKKAEDRERRKQELQEKQELERKEQEALKKAEEEERRKAEKAAVEQQKALENKEKQQQSTKQKRNKEKQKADKKSTVKKEENKNHPPERSWKEAPSENVSSQQPPPDKKCRGADTPSTSPRPDDARTSKQNKKKQKQKAGSTGDLRHESSNVEEKNQVSVKGTKPRPVSCHVPASKTTNDRGSFSPEPMDVQTENVSKAHINGDAKESNEENCEDNENKSSVENTPKSVKKNKQNKKKKKASIDDVFLPREELFENGEFYELDEAERELEEFKMFCLNTTPIEKREKIPVHMNLKGLTLKKSA